MSLIEEAEQHTVAVRLCAAAVTDKRVGQPVKMARVNLVLARPAGAEGQTALKTNEVFV